MIGTKSCATALLLSFLLAVPAAAQKKKPSLKDAFKKLKIPPAWMKDTKVNYDTRRPWQQARQEARRLLGLNTEDGRRQGIKLTYMYHVTLKGKKPGNYHEYPQNLFLAGEPAWSIKMWEWFLERPGNSKALYAHMQLAGALRHFGEYTRAKRSLDVCMRNLPGQPWRTAREADVHGAYGDLYIDWGKTSLAKKHFAAGARLYPTARQPARFKRQQKADILQTKLDRLSMKGLKTAKLRDGTYRSKALGYTGDINVTVVVTGGRISDVTLNHREKIHQNACTITPNQIKKDQTLQVDNVTGATITVDAIVTGAFKALKQAGLK